MKIILLQPTYDSHIVHPPLGLGYLAAVLEKKKHQVEIFDGTLLKATTEDFLAKIVDFQPDLIGVTIMARGHLIVQNLIKNIKNEFNIPLVIGGPQVTAYPEKMIEYFDTDFACVGEGEETIIELMAALKNKKGFRRILGLVYHGKKGEIKRNPDRPLIKDLDKIPFPAWHLMPPDKYWMVPILSPAKGYPVAPIVTSRGCPFNCAFCASNVTWRRIFRTRSPKNTVDEIEMLVKEYGVKEIHITDDNFTLIKERAEKVCDEIIKRKLAISWQCPNGVRADRLDEPLLYKMKKAGCYSVGLGVESGNQKILEGVNKNLDLGIFENVLKMLKKIGIRAYGFFILGLPGETRRTAQDTIDFAVNHPFDRAWFNILTPIPGSRIFNDYLGQKRITFDEIDWTEMDGNKASYKTAIPLKELEELQKKALKRFYYRPKIIFGMILTTGPRSVKTFLMTRFFRKHLFK